MRVIMLNGSRHFDGTTAQALQVIGQQLQQNNIEVVTVQLDSVSGYRDCDGCNQCKQTGHCRHEDIVNDIIDLLQEADGLILASPTHFGGITGSMKIVMDRLWYATDNLAFFALKPAAVVAVCSRTGAINTWHQLSNYLGCANLLHMGSQYWAILYGEEAADTALDKEGLQTMQILGDNMAWLLTAIDAVKDTIVKPEPEARQKTNFCRIEQFDQAEAN